MATNPSMNGLTQLGKYAVSEVLGKGAMGVVYKGFDPHIRRTVALKTIRRELIDDDQAATLLARFRNEAQAAGRLSHPGIVAVYEWGEAGEIAFLALEYVQGNSLREYFNRGTRFEGPDVVSVMAQLLDALHTRTSGLAPRHQAGQHHHHEQRQAEGRGLRHRPHRHLEPHPDRRRHGHARLHGA
jgi:serine/threonine protein kinase